MFFYMTDPTASKGFEDTLGLLRAVTSGDGGSFCKQAGVPSSALLYESPAASIGAPKHFVALDESTKAVVLVIRGTMSVSDALTDVVARRVAFCGGHQKRIQFILRY